MPRNSSGNYTLPVGNPVQPDTVIETSWANPTMADIASALSDSLDRYGRGGMLAEFKVADGTAPSPGMSFVSQSNMGMYRDGNNVLGLSVAGGAVMKLRDTAIDMLQPVNFPTGITGNPAFSGNAVFNGLVSLASGTLLAPSLTFTGDTDSGFFHPADGVIALVLNGVEMMRWTTSGTTNVVPPGGMLDFAGNVVPSGFLLCDGAAVSRTVYAALYAAIGLTWGAGDGVNTFNLPDMRRRVSIGSGGAAVQPPSAGVGQYGGSESKTLVTGEMPSHTHTVTDPTHTHGVNDPTHTHGGGYLRSDVGGGSGPAGGGAAFGQPIPPNVTGVTINGAGTGISLVATGGGAAWSLMQPSAVVAKIIKY
jgi:microcystin-dependent protein